MNLKSDLLDILACPQCKSPVQQSGDWILCQSASCGLRFPIRNGIPVMLISEAQKAPAK